MAEQKIDEIKGRTKEAAGDLADDPGLKREGKVDQATSTVKDVLGGAFDKAKDTVDGIADKAKEHLNRDGDDK
jgi:uncharacterized protein YjbJ (UPF0337 family)